MYFVFFVNAFLLQKKNKLSVEGQNNTHFNMNPIRLDSKFPLFNNPIVIHHQGLRDKEGWELSAVQRKIILNSAFHYYVAASCEKARTTWHVISNNLHLKSCAKSGGSNWVLIQGAIFTVLIIIIVLSGLLSLPSCYLENEVGKKA